MGHNVNGQCAAKGGCTQLAMEGGYCFSHSSVEGLSKKEKSKKYALKKNYGIAYVHYLELLKQQEGKCAICKRVPDQTEHSLGIDHCHETGVVRGLLCSNCNVGLGNFKDNGEYLEAAYMYLKQAPPKVTFPSDKI